MKKLLFILLCLPIIGFGQNWTQIGQDIDAEHRDDYNGWSVSMNYDGSRVAIGAIQNDNIQGNGPNSNPPTFYPGHVRVFENLNGSWIQLGQDIDGIVGTNEYFGSSVSLSSDGNVVAIGAPNSNGGDGLVRVYEFNGSNWTQKGLDFSGNSNSETGSSVALSNYGDTIIIGSPKGNSNGGEINIYNWNGFSWNHLEYIYGNNGQKAGESVAISGDGSIIAFGSPESCYMGGCGNRTGGIHMYFLNPSGVPGSGTAGGPGQNGVYYPMGSAVYGTLGNLDRFGQSISLSNDGYTVAAGSPNADESIDPVTNSGGTNSGMVRVLKWNQPGNPNNWSYLQTTGSYHLDRISGESSGDFSGHSISLNNDGNILAIGAYGNIGNTNESVGHVRIYQYDGVVWSQVSQDIDGEYEGDCSGDAVAISGQGSVVAIGSHYNCDQIVSSCPYSSNMYLQGHVRIYGNLGCTDSLALNYDPAAVIDNGSCCYDCGAIEGFVYEDLDSNAVYTSATENPLTNQILQLEKSNGEVSYLTTGSTGYFSFVVDTGQQVLSFTAPSNWQLTNPPQYNINVTSWDTVSDLNFGIIPEYTKGDMNISLTTSDYVCNNSANIWLNVSNVGTETITGVTVELWVNSESSVQSASGNGVVSGNYVSWSMPGDFHPFLYTNQFQDFNITVSTPGVNMMGGNVIDSARVTPFQPNLIEMSAANNYADASNTVLCSYDPNDKRILPRECFNQELDTLTYTVRFQNTGNYPATTVRIVDTLDLEKLDIMSLKILGSSHTYEWSISPPAILEIVYNNINLVDSSVSFTESQGFIKYSLAVVDSLPDLQATSTPAYIYFDNNPAIVTNEPEVRFTNNLTANMQATDVSCYGSTDGSATLNIISGASPYDISWNTGDSLTVLNNLNPGTYTVTLTDTFNCLYVDSVTVIEPSLITSANTQTVCAGDSIVVGASVYYTAGTYTDIFTANNSCDSSVITTLSVLNNSVSSINITECDSYDWNGNTYTASGTYTYSTTNVNGCDSTATLNLTINTATSSTTTLTECDSYDWNGNTYTASGSYTYSTTDINGCDSTATLNLTINNSIAQTNSWDICDGDSIIVGNSIYNTTGVYTDIFNTINGCDSTVTTDLTVSSEVTATISQNGSDILVNVLGGNTPYAYHWSTGESTQQITPTANGTYWVIIEDANQCFSDTFYYDVTWIPTNIAEVNISDINVYPNPSDDIFNIEFSSLLAQDIQVSVLNAVGEVVFIDNLKSHLGAYHNQISLKEDAHAVYFLKIQTREGTVSKKLILQ